MSLLPSPALSDLARVALALADEAGFSVSVETAGGELVSLARRHPARHLVITLAAPAVERAERGAGVFSPSATPRRRAA